MRDHFKDFSVKALFGKYKDVYWWGHQLRGEAAKGVIDKCYRLAREGWLPGLRYQNEFLFVAAWATCCEPIILRNAAVSKLGPEYRSYLPIAHEDLVRLAAIAAADRADYFARYPDWAELYAGRILCTALCQGAALHYLNGKAGIQDFDVYTFYAEHPARRWYARRRAVYDFGDPKFGQSSDRPQFVGRRVDVWARAIPAKPGDDPAPAARAYLAAGTTETARRLAQKAVVLLAPAGELGAVAWPQMHRVLLQVPG